ncbi:hypothetical protein Salat_0189900 [Sesamum alatum]|uniref:Uncharacterized protein n=1 Tax=Sesamum alatum TaxID=300844 RepID=A0AAE1YY17_9LAMI|nr:hypothetical protein Salat_0189900 [Sesamum alatum]
MMKRSHNWKLQKSADEVVNAQLTALDEGDKKSFDRGRVEGFNHGLTEGHARYLTSDDHKVLLAVTRVDVACDFLKSIAFGITLEIKTTCYTIDAFELCRSQIKTLGGFIEGFDQNRLEPTFDAKLQTLGMGEHPAAEPNEFDVLIDKIVGAGLPS